LKIRATGENALVAHAAGVNIARVRAVNLIIAAVLSSVGGAALSVGWVRTFIENITFGRGYIALAAVYCGRWNPLIVLAICLVFGAGEALAFRAQAGLVGINPFYLFMVPYALTILVIALAGKGRGPADAGKPFIRR
jgi:simple sugar transport system permease protein